ncbi:hypothetical protein BDV96DRAFT_580306 [Lophiotrema nucula]|uniref:Uncharacterized protein n=1 Tax=Lophiotrema nucula TaxID=690887 RepID=A0A6A5Z133_9PLEO|nr:hypothetical protein BDV96DRAFT_580306 [Lophiotrema nucula]
MPVDINLAIAAGFPPAMLTTLVAILLFYLAEYKPRRREPHHTQHTCWHRNPTSSPTPDVEANMDSTIRHASMHREAARTLHSLTFDLNASNTPSIELQPMQPILHRPMPELDLLPRQSLPRPKLSRAATNYPSIRTRNRKTEPLHFDATRLSSVNNDFPSVKAKADTISMRALSASQLYMAARTHAAEGGSGGLM